MSALYFSRSLIPCIRDVSDSEWQGLYRRHIGVYVYRADFLKRMVGTPPCAMEQAEKLEQLRALYIGGRIAVRGIPRCVTNREVITNWNRNARICTTRST